MEVRVYAPGNVLYEGDASKVALPVVNGTEVVMDNHAPFVAELGAGEIVIGAGQGERIKISGGIAKAYNNILDIIVSSADA